MKIYQKFFEHGISLKRFLDAGADKKLESIEIMEEYRRAAATTTALTPSGKLKQQKEQKM
jgi:hypothetical protein